MEIKFRSLTLNTVFYARFVVHYCSVCRCNRDVLLGVVVDEGVGSGVGSHHISDADVC